MKQISVSNSKLFISDIYFHSIITILALGYVSIHIFLVFDRFYLQVSMVINIDCTLCGMLEFYIF